MTAGWQKLGSAAWMHGGQALQRFWQHAVVTPPGLMPGAVYYGWYHAFLQYVPVHGWCPWFAKLVALGETSVGLLLLLGAFTGFAAGLGPLLNFNYMLAGSSSANPVLFSLEVLLVLAWRVAGSVGLDAVLIGPRSPLQISWNCRTKSSPSTPSAPTCVTRRLRRTPRSGIPAPCTVSPRNM